MLGFSKRLRRRRQERRDTDVYRAVGDVLHTALILGGRTGTPGEPFREDVEQRDGARKVADSLPVGSPGERFYRNLQRVAEGKMRTEERGLGLMRAYRPRVRPWRWRSARLLIRALSLRCRSAHAVGGGSRIASRHGRAEASCRGTSMAALHFRSRSDSALRRAVALSTRPRPHPLAIAANVPGDSWPRAKSAR